MKNWGFESVFGDNSVTVREQFKLTLDSEYEDDRGFTCENARQWYYDYLRCLHREIEKFFDTSVPRWRSLHVEYSFSTPTTWKNPAMVASIEKLIRSAGFTNTSQQTVRMGLTEAEAAAIEASTTQYQVGDVFLICDAGGGTTDVNVLKVKSTDTRLELEPLDPVEGSPVGSTLIDKIFELIDEQLTHLDTSRPNEQVSYVILSGGLGSSPYLFESMKTRYEMNFGFRSGNTANIRIMRVLEPQLAVVRGLVRERTQQIGLSNSVGQEIFGTRRCRNSYGIAVRVPYDETKHRWLPTITDQLNSSRWVEHMVDWFIQKGEEVSVKEGISRIYSVILAESECRDPRRAHIVMSSLPNERLPTLATDPGCKEVVVVNYQLTGNDMKLKNRQFWKLRKKYWKAQFSFVVNIGPADLKFSIVGKNGVLSTSHNSLSTDFMDPSDRPQLPARRSNNGRILTLSEA